MTVASYCAVYDFELFPYALGDVLTWNVLTAIRAEELGRERVDAYICMDERHPASIFQGDFVTPENSGLLFSELFGAFGTHPRLGNLFLYRRREELLERLREASAGDDANTQALTEYEEVLAHRAREPSMLQHLAASFSGRSGEPSEVMAHFMKYIHSHERINAFAARHARIPLLRPSMGCEPDVEALLANRFAGRRIVIVHMRLRRLDAGYGAASTYARDSDFLEWYEFLKAAGERHPDVQFVTVGRIQEKPLELLRLPNVASLRAFGLGLGHELSLILRSDLFIGTSSGFAAMVNFSEVPYFITKMTPQSCNAYAIEPGSERLPFATDRQYLVYEPETRELLMNLLERGLRDVPPRGGASKPSSAAGAVDPRSWEWERAQWLYPGATSTRFFTDDDYVDRETGFLVWREVQHAQAAVRRGAIESARDTLRRLETSFPRMCRKFPEVLRLRMMLAADPDTLRSCAAALGALRAREAASGRLRAALRRYWRHTYPLRIALWTRLGQAWARKHRIPGKLVRMALRRPHVRPVP
jgi:hypothetical protein